MRVENSVPRQKKITADNKKFSGFQVPAIANGFCVINVFREKSAHLPDLGEG